MRIFLIIILEFGDSLIESISQDLSLDVILFLLSVHSFFFFQLHQSLLLEYICGAVNLLRIPVLILLRFLGQTALTLVDIVETESTIHLLHDIL